MSSVSSQMPAVNPAQLGQAAVAGGAAVGQQLAAAGSAAGAAGRIGSAGASRITEQGEHQAQMKMQVEAEYRRMLVDMVRMGTESIQSGLKDYLAFRMWEEEMEYKKKGYEVWGSEEMEEAREQARLELEAERAAARGENVMGPPAPPDFSVNPFRAVEIPAGDTLPQRPPFENAMTEPF